jgi:hypothetical protein
MKNNSNTNNSNTNANSNNNSNFHLEDFDNKALINRPQKRSICNCFFSIKVQNSFYNIILKILEKPIILNISIFFIFYFCMFVFWPSEIYAETNNDIKEIGANNDSFEDTLFTDHPEHLSAQSLYQFFRVNQPSYYDSNLYGVDYYFKRLSGPQRIILQKILANDPEFVKNFGSDIRNIIFENENQKKLYENLVKKIFYRFSHNPIWFEMNPSILYLFINDGCGAAPISCEYAKLILDPDQFRYLIEHNDIYVWKTVKDSMKGKIMTFDLLDKIKENDLKTTNHMRENYFLDMTKEEHEEWLSDMREEYLKQDIFTLTKRLLAPIDRIDPTKRKW